MTEGEIHELAGALVANRSRESALVPGETYFVRVTQVLQSSSHYDRETDTVVNLGTKLTGLRLSFLHRRGCCYLRDRQGSGDNVGVILTVKSGMLAEALPRCRKCWPLARVKNPGKSLAKS